MTGKAEIFKFTTNVPVNCNIRFVDVRPGKPFNDPQKGPITLPAQVSIKGTFDGVETIAYLKGPVWKNIKALAAGGVIADDWAERTDELEGVTASTSIPVVMGNVKATLAKGPKDKYENMVFGNGAPAAPKRLSYEEAAKPSGPSRGVVPGMDEDDVADRMAVYAAMENVSAAEVNALMDADPYLEPPRAPTPHRVPSAPSPAASAVAPDAAIKMGRARQYLDLLAWVKAQEPTKGMSDVAQQAAAATIWIDWKQAGLVK